MLKYNVYYRNTILKLFNNMQSLLKFTKIYQRNCKDLI